MSDYISRQALMKEFSDFVRRSNNSDFANTPTWNDAVSLVGSMPSVPVDKGFIPRESAINTALNMYHRCNGSLDDYRALMVESLEVLTGMPKAERWIPCAERLPEEVQMVIVTIRGHDVIRCEDGETLEEAIDRVMQMLRVSVGFRDEDGWNGADGYPMMVQPVAWMPLPEPWKGEE